MKGVSVQLGGRERTLRYDLNAISEIGDRLAIKVRLNKIAEDLVGVPLPISAVRTILWAGLIHAEPELTEKQVGGWVDGENLKEVLAAFFSLFGGRLSEKDRQSIAEKMGLEMPPGEPVET